MKRRYRLLLFAASLTFAMTTLVVGFAWADFNSGEVIGAGAIPDAGYMGGLTGMACSTYDSTPVEGPWGPDSQGNRRADGDPHLGWRLGCEAGESGRHHANPYEPAWAGGERRQ